MFGALLCVCVVLRVCKQGAVGQGVCTNGTENHLKDCVVCDMFWWGPAHSLFWLLHLCFDWTSCWLSSSSPRTTQHPSPKNIVTSHSLSGTVVFLSHHLYRQEHAVTHRSRFRVEENPFRGAGIAQMEMDDVTLYCHPQKYLFPTHLLNVANITNMTAALRVGQQSW